MAAFAAPWQVATGWNPAGDVTSGIHFDCSGDGHKEPAGVPPGVEGVQVGKVGLGLFRDPNQLSGFSGSLSIEITSSEKTRTKVADGILECWLSFNCWQGLFNCTLYWKIFWQVTTDFIDGQVAAIINSSRGKWKTILVAMDLFLPWSTGSKAGGSVLWIPTWLVDHHYIPTKSNACHDV